MRKEFWEDLKGCLRAKLIKARADWKYSQEEMAEALDLPAHLSVNALTQLLELPAYRRKYQTFLEQTEVDSQ